MGRTEVLIGAFAAAFCGIAGACQAGKGPATVAMYQQFDQSNRRFVVKDQLKLHPDGFFDQSKLASEIHDPNCDEARTAPPKNALAPCSDSRQDGVCVDTEPHGNPPKDAGAQAWLHPAEYWKNEDRKKGVTSPPPAENDSLYCDPHPQTWKGSWRILDKPNGAVLQIPKDMHDLPDGAVIEFMQAMPLGPVGKTWNKTDFVLPAKDFDRYFSY